jgi:hypothetical protein
MGVKQDTDAVNSAIQAIMEQKRKAAGKAAHDYSLEALKIFMGRQMSAKYVPPKQGEKIEEDTDDDKKAAIAYVEAYSGPDKTEVGDPWINHTRKAVRGVYAEHESTEEYVAFRLLHSMSYGVYLELAHNRKYAVIEPVVRSLAAPFLADIKAIYAG